MLFRSEEKLEPPQLEEAIEPSYRSQPLSFVVAMDTLGQDREFTKEQKDFVFKTINMYKKIWEEHEKARLISDRVLKEEEKAKDDEFLENSAAQLQEDEDKEIKDRMTEKVEVVDEELREETERKHKKEKILTEEEQKEKDDKELVIRCELRIKQITQGVFKERLIKFNQYNVVKMIRIMQSLFYLLKFNREDLCEIGTNKLFWKKAKNFWDENLLNELNEYTPIGPKEGEYKRYQTINFIEKNLEGIVEEEDRKSVA